jgi:hypothetical protein
MSRSVVSRVLFGLCVAGAGVLVIGHMALGWDYSWFTKGWWALFLIIPAIAGMISDRPRFWNVALLLLGVWLYLEAQGLLGKEAWTYFIGAMLVAVGIAIAAGGGHSHGPGSGKQSGGPSGPDGGSSAGGSGHEEFGGHYNSDASDRPEYTGIFSSPKYSNSCKTLRGGSASSVFGSLTVDLRQADVAQTADFEVAAVFGTLTLLLPEGMPVRTEITPVFGALYNDSKITAPAEGQPFLRLQGAAVFGTIRMY